MFCSKCGKQINDDSTFCPYCGNKVGGNIPVQPTNSGVNANVPPVNYGMNTVTPLNKGLNKKIVIGSAVGLIAILIIIIGVVKLLSGSGKTMPEKLLNMSWKEVSELTESDFEDMLDEEGILYDYETYENLWGFKTETTVPFMNADCLLVHGSADVDNDAGFEPHLSAQFSVLGLAWETEDAFIKDRKELEDSLKGQMIKGSTVFSGDEGFGTYYLYAVEVSDKNVDGFIEYLEEDDKEEVDLSDCSMYKFVQLFFAKDDDLSYFYIDDFPTDKSYTDYMCEVTIFHTPMTKNEFVALAASYNYDAISDKDIDIEDVRKNIDPDLLSNFRFGSEYALRMIYFVENHNMDIRSGMDLGTDELKNIWYIRNFNFDIESNELIDTNKWGSGEAIVDNVLAGYSAVYIAYKYGYDITNNSYFESDLDRSKYLIDNNINPETGELFEDSTDNTAKIEDELDIIDELAESDNGVAVDTLTDYYKVDTTVPELANLSNWKQIYTTWLSSVSLSDYAGYFLEDVNDDSIPEIYLVDNSADLSGLLYYLDANGTVCYIPLYAYYNGKIVMTNDLYGFITDAVCEWNSSRRTWDCIFYGEYASDNSYIAVDDEPCSKEDYYLKFNELWDNNKAKNWDSKDMQLFEDVSVFDAILTY